MKEIMRYIMNRTRLRYLLSIFHLIVWEVRRQPSPPPHLIKQRALLDRAKIFNLKVFVETGTYYGDMVEAMKDYFDHVFSIELSEDLCDKAKKRFKNERHVELIHGDSGEMVGKIVDKLNQPALFWLDAHYSAGKTVRGDKDTPVLEELHQILNARDLDHVVMIDDARFFGTDSSYPAIEELECFVASRRKDMDLEVKNDIIRLTPKAQ